MPVPQPEFSITIDRTPEPVTGDDTKALLALPTCSGVFAFEDKQGMTLCLAVTANLRRLVRKRLQPITVDDEPTRRVDYGRLTTRVRALPVGSPFEADWAYLQLARVLVPSAVKHMTDRWRSWWIHINPDTAFPRFVKTCTPGGPPTGTTGLYFGPMKDKHAAARFIETLQAGFDLCRYHHILIESPDGRACAYKEMDRCPAPCDGTVSMTQYRRLIDAAVTFACNRQPTMDALEVHMQQLSSNMEFEAAERAKRQRDDLAPAMKPAFRHVDRFERFHFIALCPSEHPNYCRVFIINGGWISPIADISHDCPDEVLESVLQTLNKFLAAHQFDFNEQELENIGLVCTHLLRPKKAILAPIEFLRWHNECDARELRNTINKLQRQVSKTTTNDDSNSLTEQIIDSL